MIDLVKKYWPVVAASLISFSVLLWARGCEPKVPSPKDPTKNLTRAELDAELKFLLNTYEIRLDQLEDKERLRRLILENALIMVQTGTFNPLGILTGFAALYGVTSATQSAGRVIRRRKESLVLKGGGGNQPLPPPPNRDAPYET